MLIFDSVRYKKYCFLKTFIFCICELSAFFPKKLKILVIAIPVMVVNETYPKLSEIYTSVIYFLKKSSAAFAKSKQSYIFSKKMKCICLAGRSRNRLCSGGSSFFPAPLGCTLEYVCNIFRSFGERFIES